MYNGYQVDLTALSEAAQGVQAAHDALASMISPVSDRYSTFGSAGEALIYLDLAGDELGHAGLADAWHSFLNRWSWDLRTRLATAEKMVQHLQDSRSIYQKAEDGAVGALKEILEDILGNPDTQNAAQESWSQIGQDIRPDWTRASFWNGQQLNQTVNTYEGDLGSMGRDVQGSVTDPDGLGSTLVPGLSQVEQVDQEFHGR